MTVCLKLIMNSLFKEKLKKPEEYQKGMATHNSF